MENVDFAIKALDIARFILLAVMVAGLIVGILFTITAVGPNCPAPVPASWLGYCEAYDVR